MSIINKNLPYRENVCLLIYNSDNKIFIGERYGEPGIWQLPQGGVETGYSLEENALREAHEELGAPIENFTITCRLQHTHKYDFDTPPTYALKNFRGQSQTFWLIKYTGSDDQINLEISDKEFQGWQWAEADKITEIVEAKRVNGYIPAIQEFKQIFSTEK